MDDFYRNRQTISSSLSSSVVEIDKMVKNNKETQMASNIMSSSSSSSENTFVPIETEANLDRHNQNISLSQKRICLSSSTSETTSQSESQTCALMLNCPSLAANTCRSHCCTKCLHLLQSLVCKTTTTTSSSISTMPIDKCTCENDDVIVSSSSISIISKHFPVKSHPNQNPISKQKYIHQQNKTIIITCLAPGPERLEPGNNLSKTDDFYSCSSDDSENEVESIELTKLKFSELHRNRVMLQLLHKIENLITEDNSKKQATLHIAEKEALSNTEKKTNRTIAPEPKIDFEQQRELYQTPLPFNGPTWSPYTCFAQVSASPQVQYPVASNILSQPYNINEPELFACEDSKDIFIDCHTSDKSNLSCKCPDFTTICPLHGSLKQLLKNANLTCFDSSKVSDLEPRTTNEEELSIYRYPTGEQKEELESDEKAGVFLIPKCTIEPCKEFTEEDVSQALHPRYDPTVTCKLVDDEKDPLRKEKPDILEVPADTEVDIDEELQPRYVPKIFADPSEMYTPNPDSLSIYEDEEPKQSEGNVDEELIGEKIPFYPYEDYEPCRDCLSKYDDKKPSGPNKIDQKYEKDKIIVKDKSLKNNKISRDIETPNEEQPAELEKTPKSVIENLDKLPLAAEFLCEKEVSPYIVRISKTTDHNIYNFLPEIDKNDQDDYRQIIRYVESEETYYPEKENEIIDEEYELVKEKIVKNRKNKIIKQDNDADKIMTLPTLKQFKGEGSPEEMKFFINSLTMDLDAMMYARRKSQFEKNICKTKSARVCARESFPVTITEVTDLGASSLYVKWIIHDCSGIGGYEIYTDGYLTNRFYNSKHNAAVITNVDVTLPHRISLVAQPLAAEDIEFKCNMSNNKTRSRSLLWKTNMTIDRKSLFTLWTPSIYLYDPATM